MGVADAGDVFRRRAEFHRDDGFRDQLRRDRAHDVDAQDFVGRRVGQEFHHARRVAQRACTAVGHERERAGLVSDAFLLELLLGLADPRDFRRGVDDPRDRVEVDVTVLAGDALGNGDTLFFRLVRQHRAAHDVAHGPDARDVRAAFVVDGHEAALVQLHADGLDAEAVGVRHAADRDDQALKTFALRGTGSIGVVHGDRVVGLGDAVDLHAQLDVQALLGEQLVRFLGDLLVDRAQERRQAFQHGDLGTQAAPHGTHLQADHAGADDAQLGRDGVDGQRAGVRQDDFLVERCARQFAGVRAGRDDHVLRRDAVRGRARHIDGVAFASLAGERAAAVEEGDLVLLEQVDDAVVVGLDDALFALEHLAQVQRETGNVDAVLGERVTGVLEVFRRLQQCLRRDAADVGAGAAQCRAALGVLPFVDAGGLEAQLRSADRGHVAAGAAADHDDVELFFSAH